jgi:uncharacterized Tic20 family protein
MDKRKKLMELCAITNPFSNVVRQNPSRAVVCDYDGLRFLKFGTGLARLEGVMNTSLTPHLANTSSPTSNERLAAAIAHGGTCVAWFFAPLVVYLIEKDRSSYASRQALQALLWSGFGTLVSLATCGLAIPIFMGFHILAAVRALEGQDYEYPLIGDLARKLQTV